MLDRAETVAQIVLARLHDALLPHLDQEEQALFPALMARSSRHQVIADEVSGMHADHLLGATCFTGCVQPPTTSVRRSGPATATVLSSPSSRRSKPSSFGTFTSRTTC